MMEFIIYGLATWRISSLLVNEAGPGNFFRRLREWTGIEHDEGGAVTVIPDGFWSSLLSCIWCASLWVGLGWVGLGWIAPDVALKVAMVFSFSAVAIGWEKWIKSSG
jgi:hypothetical protein